MLNSIVAFVAEDPVGIAINIAFGLMLLPALFDRQKPSLITSFMTVRF